MKANSLSPQRRSIRLPGYDYAQPGAYFVTVVAAGRECLFGNVENGNVSLGKLGQAAEQQWPRLPRRFPNLELDAFVVMPNHVHGIIILHGRGTAGTGQDMDDVTLGRAPTEAFQGLCRARSRPLSVPTRQQLPIGLASSLASRMRPPGSAITLST